MLKACCEALVYFGEHPGQQAWGHFGALFKLGGLILKRTTAVLGRMAHAPHRGFPLGRLIVSSPPLIHIFHLSSNEPLAVWYLSGHLCIRPCRVHVQ